MARKQPKGKNGAPSRASVTFPPDLYSTLEDLAKEKKVSIAWVVRDAVEQYLSDKWPLFGRNHDR